MLFVKPLLEFREGRVWRAGGQEAHCECSDKFGRIKDSAVGERTYFDKCHVNNLSGRLRVLVFVVSEFGSFSLHGVSDSVSVLSLCRVLFKPSHQKPAARNKLKSDTFHIRFHD
jgi:hypothetical protein